MERDSHPPRPSVDSSEQSEAVDVGEEDSDRFTGLGVGLGLTLFGLLCISLMPDYFDAEGGWRLAWGFVGGLFGLVGVVGSLLELAKHMSVDGLDDLGVVLGLGGFAGILHLIQTDITGTWSVVLRVLAVVFLLIAVVGSGIAIARIVGTLAVRERPVRGGRGVALLSAATALVGLATAILNFVTASRT